MVGPTLPSRGFGAARPAALRSVRQSLGVGTETTPEQWPRSSCRAALPLAPRCVRMRGSLDTPGMDERRACGPTVASRLHPLLKRESSAERARRPEVVLGRRLESRADALARRTKQQRDAATVGRTTEERPVIT